MNVKISFKFKNISENERLYEILATKQTTINKHPGKSWEEMEQQLYLALITELSEDLEEVDGGEINVVER